MADFFGGGWEVWQSRTFFYEGQEKKKMHKCKKLTKELSSLEFEMWHTQIKQAGVMFSALKAEKNEVGWGGVGDSEITYTEN